MDSFGFHLKPKAPLDTPTADITLIADTWLREETLINCGCCVEARTNGAAIYTLELHIVVRMLIHVLTVLISYV